MSILLSVSLQYFLMLCSMELSRTLKNARVFRAVTGITAKEFEQLLPTFTEVLIASALSKPGRRRAHGG
jgi:hypothetical protein